MRPRSRPGQDLRLGLVRSTTWAASWAPTTCRSVGGVGTSGGVGTKASESTPGVFGAERYYRTQPGLGGLWALHPFGVCDRGPLSLLSSHFLPMLLGPRDCCVSGTRAPGGRASAQSRLSAARGPVAQRSEALFPACFPAASMIRCSQVTVVSERTEILSSSSPDNEAELLKDQGNEAYKWVAGGLEAWVALVGGVCQGVFAVRVRVRKFVYYLPVGLTC
jgi:hypothetical protein